MTDFADTFCALGLAGAITYVLWLCIRPPRKHR